MQPDQVAAISRMASNDKLTPEEAKAQEMYRIVCGQRDGMANALTDALGDVAAWRARWNDVELIRARLAELEAK